MTERTNDDWLRELRDDGPAGDAARRDLRSTLVAGLRHALGDRAQDHIEDFAQEAMLRLLQKLDAFRGDSRFTTWAMSIAMRVAWSELRRARWKDVSFDQLESTIGEDAVGQAKDAEHALLRARALAALENAIGHALSERQRTVIAAELRGMPQDEIARRLGCTRNAVYKLGYDGRRALLRVLEAEEIRAEDLAS